MSITKARKTECKDRLSALLRPGMTIYTILRSVSRSGMSRVIDPYVIIDGEPCWIGSMVADLIGHQYDDKGRGVRMQGCGMDMGFELVYILSRSLWPTGYPCTGENTCPSNDHSNHGPNRDNYSSSVIHSNGGYALKQRWM